MSTLSSKPQTIGPHTWYYEQRGGLLIVHEIRDGDNYIRTDQFNLPWRKIEASLRRRRADSEDRRE